MAVTAKGGVHWGTANVGIEAAAARNMRDKQSNFSITPQSILESTFHGFSASASVGADFTVFGPK